MIPTEARIHLDNIADGLTPSQYLDAIWFRRENAHTGAKRSTGKWPIQHKPEKKRLTIVAKNK